MNLSVIFRYKKYEVKKRQEYKNISGLDISYDSYSDIRNEFISSLFLDLYFPFSSDKDDIKYFINTIFI